VSNIVIRKDGQVMATARSCAQSEILGEEDWEGIYLIKCFFFNRVQMSPPILFEHLAGAALSRFFNGTEVLLDDGVLEKDLRYVHGRSEVMRGKPEVTSVLLARSEPEGGVPDALWLSYLPEIYKKFLAPGRSKSEKT